MSSMVSLSATRTVVEPAPRFVPSDVTGLAFDRRRGILCVADCQTGSLVQFDWVGRRWVTEIEVDGVISSTPLGAIAIAPDDSVYVTRQSYGGRGQIVRIRPDGKAEVIAALPRDMLRFGLAYDDETRGLYTTQYRKTIAGPVEGAIVHVDLATGDATTLVVGMAQPVGIAKLGSMFVVSDARARAVYRIDLREGRAEACVELLELDRPGALCARGRESVLVASYDDVVDAGSIHEVWLDGRRRIVARGTWNPRALATDGVRAYVAVRGADRLLEFRL